MKIFLSNSPIIGTINKNRPLNIVDLLAIIGMMTGFGIRRAEIIFCHSSLDIKKGLPKEALVNCLDVLKRGFGYDCAVLRVGGEFSILINHIGGRISALRDGD